jgi:hypothetical protein
MASIIDVVPHALFSSVERNNHVSIYSNYLRPQSALASQLHRQCSTSTVSSSAAKSLAHAPSLKQAFQNSRGDKCRADCLRNETIYAFGRTPGIVMRWRTPPASASVATISSLT